MRSGVDPSVRGLWRFGPATLAIPGLALGPDHLRALWIGLLIACAVLMIIRLEHPVLAWLGAGIVAAAMTVLEPRLYIITVFIPLLPFAQIASAGVLWRTIGFLAASMFPVLLIGVYTGGFARLTPYEGLVSSLLLPFPVYGIAALWAHGLGTRQAYAEMLLERADRLEREQAQQATLAVLSERGRIARDLHDVITHGVAVMVVQADAADTVWETDASRSRQAVRAVAETGRTVMSELRAMLDAMRDEQDATGGAQRSATVGLDGAGDLVGRLDRSGVATELRITGDLDSVPPAVGLAAERILRESLTNVLRHADADRTAVTIDIAADTVRLRVADDGRGLPGDPVPGYGIRGMHERARLAGGEVRIGPGGDGGTVVEATLPFTAA